VVTNTLECLKFRKVVTHVRNCILQTLEQPNSGICDDLLQLRALMEVQTMMTF
jgi:hypothetical protein